MKPLPLFFALRPRRISDARPSHRVTSSHPVTLTSAFLLFLLFFLPAPARAQDCPPTRYEALLREAKQAADKGQYDLAINKLQSAKTCQPQNEAEVNSRILKVFESVNNERKEAQRQRLIAENRAIEIQRQKEASDKSARANRLAAMALQKGKTDYTMGWHLAYLAYQASFDSVQGGSTEPGVSGIMHDIVSDSTAWFYKTLEGHTAFVSGAVFSPDGQFVLTCSWDKTARLGTKTEPSQNTPKDTPPTFPARCFPPTANSF